ncbi:hypothetical protein EYF80_028220 [Liparis tanakae]|uniref:Uncharacterized protein n=1 Tax=Liparis tanakae TaxID=230148 RepID=A0A4Z2H6R4_9TELE|nr:hypothetical protein EYF80_028220 [Liparis tanakae]
MAVFKACSTWQRGGGGPAAGGPEQLDVRGMKPASLPLLASSLPGKEPLFGNHPWAPSSRPSHQSSRCCSTPMTSPWEKLSVAVTTSPAPAPEARPSVVSGVADHEETARANRGAEHWGAGGGESRAILL